MGRHTKASSRKRAFALAAVPVVTTLPMLGMASANAAPQGGVWDKLAHCESTSDWSINTGNGYYGGVQFSYGTWKAFGGGKYASRADLATKAQQIDIAIKVQKEQGWNAWPGCNRKLGGLANLVKAGDMTGGATVADRATRSTVRKAIVKTTKAKTTTRVKTVAPKKAVKTVVVKRSANVKRFRMADLHLVKSGETLSSIARTERIAGGWHTLAQLNKRIVKDANLIYPGQVLRLTSTSRRD